MKTHRLLSNSRMGRPSVLGGNAIVVTMRISQEQNRKFKAAAKKVGKKKSEWMRDALTVFVAYSVEP